MKKVIFFLGLVFLFISCSNNQIKVADEDINVFFQHIRSNIKNNNISAIESDFENNIYNKKVIKELKKYDFKDVKIIFSKAKIQGNYAENIIGLVFSEEVIYLHGEYKLTKGKWKIERVENGRKDVEKK
ncbi:hypothetical protein [Fusobacterium sp. MFO224]|uniref:hypothetical protein n=1 Tax=Fusobacterium sp. MFO224 TaxID=3378070 RepID=UPI0038546628